MSAPYAPTWPELVFPDRDSWLSARNQLGIGASEVAALFNDPKNPLRGISSYDSPVSLNWRKRGLIEREQRTAEDEEHLEWSTFIEPAIAGWFERKVMAEKEPFASLVDPGQWTIQTAAADQNLAVVPWFSTLDRVLVDEAGKPLAVLEIKNASEFMRSEWTEEPPLSYQLQVQTQLAVTGLPYGYLIAAIGGRAPKWARINRNEKVIGIIRDRVIAAWDLIQRHQDPPMDAHPKTASAILHRWPNDSGERVSLPPASAEHWDLRQSFGTKIQALELERDLLTNELKAAIGEASFGDLPDGRALSLKTDKRGVRSLREVAA